MKKMLLAILLLCLLCSCGGVAEETMPAEYDADVSINIDGREYSAIYEKRADYDKLTFLSPENLAGVNVTLCEGTATVEMNGMTFESEAFTAMFDFLPIEAFGAKTVGEREYLIKPRGVNPVRF